MPLRAAAAATDASGVPDAASTTVPRTVTSVNAFTGGVGGPGPSGRRLGAIAAAVLARGGEGLDDDTLVSSAKGGDEVVEERVQPARCVRLEHGEQPAAGPDARPHRRDRGADLRR